MRKFFTHFLFILFISIFAQFAFKSEVKALSITFPKFDVDIAYRDNGELKIVEDAIYRFDGNANGFRRDIPLNFSRTDVRCVNNPQNLCGGFSAIKIDKLYIDNVQQDIDKGEYSVQVITLESGETFLRVEKRLWPTETFVENEQFDIVLEYSVIGHEVFENGLKAIYWNLLPVEHGLISNSNITFKFPSKYIVRKQNTKIFGSQVSISDAEFTNNSIVFRNLRNINDSDTVTLFYELSVTKQYPNTISANYKNVAFGSSFMFKPEGSNSFYSITQSESEKIKNMPEGEYTVRVENSGYKPQEFSINITNSDNSENIETISIELEEEFIVTIIKNIAVVLNILAILLLPFAIWKIYEYHNINGKDINPIKTIIPIFKVPQIPDFMSAYGIVFEKVELKNFGALIIFLAVNGYIKIKEVKKKKEYLFTRTPKEDSELPATSKAYLDALFGKKTEISSKNIDYSYVTKLNTIISDIYKNLENEKIFVQNPQNAKNKTLSYGVGFLILSILLLVGGSIGATFIVKNIAFVLLGLPLFVYGILMIFISVHAPARTKLGSKLYAELLGFKMYLGTAEKYRVQNNDPEDFQKFLPYAMIFGIEKEWAKAFEGMNIENPEWYDSNGGILNSLILADLTNGVLNASNSSVVSAITAHNASSAGSSGGGSFGGGFSGGGGGGGSAGGW